MPYVFQIFLNKEVKKLLLIKLKFLRIVPSSILECLPLSGVKLK